MLAALVRFSLTQRILMLLLACIVIGAGIRAFLNLPIDAFPDVSSTQVKIIIKAPGMTPEEVEARITAPIEVEMLGIPQQTMLRSIAKYGLTDITVDFEDGADIYWARQQVSERLTSIWGDLPPDIEGGIAPMTTPLGEMFMFTIDGEGSLQERRALLDWIIRPALRTVPGVADVNALGGYVRVFEVVPNAEHMLARTVSLDDLDNALSMNNRDDGAGRIEEGEEVLLVRSAGSIRTLENIRDIVVATRGNHPVRISDVADVRIGSLSRYGAVTQNGEGEAVQALVLGLPGANAREVVQGVREQLKALKDSLPPGISLNVFYDRGNLVQRAVNTVSKALVEATILVILLLLLFLGNFRAALTVALILPLAALVTFILMSQFGMSANLMSLGGLAIAIGMLVDAAVVVVENIVSRLDEQKPDSRLPRMHVIYRAVREVSLPVTSGILVIIIVFLPLLTLQGLEGKLFIPVAMTIVFALAGSLLLSLTLIPLLSSMLLGKASHKEPWLVRQLERLYIPSLNWALANVRIVVGAAITLLVMAAIAYTLTGKTFMPTMDEGNVIIQLEKLPSISLDRSADIDMRVQRALLEQVPEVTRIVARAGSDEIGLDPMGLNETDSFMVIKPRSEWRMDSKDELLDEMRNVMDQFPGVSYGFTQPIEMRVSEMLTGVRGDVAIKLFGDDSSILNRKAQEIASVVAGLEGSRDVISKQNEGVQYLSVRINRLASGRLGLSVNELENLLRSQLEGRVIGTVYEGLRRTPLLIRGEQADFHDLQIVLPDGNFTALSSIAELVREEGPVMVERELGNRYSVISAYVGGRDLVGFVEEARQAVLEKVELPVGYRLEWGGQFENQQRAARRLSIVIPVAIVLVFLLLFSTFKSVRQSVLVLTNIPFALVGGIFALWLSGEYLSVPASIGFIALLGIAVLNGVVMLTYFNQLSATGMPIARVVVEGSVRRLRPVMMTASIAAFGLVPLLFASGPGSEIQRPLAIVVIGGLVSSTLLTLLLLPALYRRYGTLHHV
jgi:cobalt-zinc-cadmium resistance protein CzcA